MTSNIYLKDFEKRDDFYPAIDLMLTVKSFDLQAIRARYIASRKNKTGRAGSVERRKVSTGGIVSLRIENGKVVREDVLARMKEPRGIHSRDGLLSIAAESMVFLIDGSEMRQFTSPWFSYIHTIDISPDGKRVLVASSGLDCLFEYNLESLEQTREWFAWENGFQIARDPETGGDLYLTRKPEEAQKLQAEGKKVLLVEDPTGQTLPTAKRAAFINSVCYDIDQPDQWLATYFHEGAVFSIDSKTGKAEKVLGGLKNPHGGRRFKGQYMATSTGTGEIVLGNENQQTRISFEGLEGKAEGLEGMEWLQNSIFSGDLIITIDSNRTAFVIFDLNQKCYSLIPYNDNWAVQDMVEIIPTENQISRIKSLNAEV